MLKEIKNACGDPDAEMQHCISTLILWCSAFVAVHTWPEKFALANARSVEKSLLCPIIEKTKLVTQALGRENY